MKDLDMQALLDRYRQGTATEAEKALLENWYLQRDIDAISELSPLEFAEDLEMLGRGLPLARPVRKISWLPRIAAAAAVLAIFFTAYLEWPAKPLPLRALYVPANQQKDLVLADGSRVWVNSGSQLKYPKSFSGKTREVYLSGEAYFDIQHDSHKAFIIHTGKVITTVLGTAFDIKEDRINHTIQVTVTRGKVSVASGGKLLGIITPNQQISFNTANEKTVAQKVDAEAIIAWQKVDLRFEDITFADAAIQLEQRFHVKISFANEQLRNDRFTGASLRGEKLEDILQTMCDFNHARYQKQPDGSILIQNL